MTPRLHNLLIGVGNAFRHDDAAGLAVARGLKTARLAGYTILEQSGEGTALLEAWARADAVILIDAVRSRAAAGTIHCVDALTSRLPAKFLRCSSHAFGVAEAIELARALHRLPPALEIFGIEGQDFSPGTGLSAAVERAVAEVIARIHEEAGGYVDFVPNKHRTCA
jgi:hydrogenase maturation protease